MNEHLERERLIHDLMKDNMRVLGLDEKHIVNQMAVVFLDIETGELLEMKETNKPDKISETIRKTEEKDGNEFDITGVKT